MSDRDTAQAWSERFGLALAPLFESAENPPAGNHQVLLDGGHGTFALSSSEEELWRENQAAGWVWSSDIPHHVTVTAKKVAVLRWDQPQEPRIFARDGVDRNLDRFYDYLTKDRLRSNRTVVEHLLGFFRRVRSLCLEAKIPDDRSTEVFIASIASMIAPAEAIERPDALGISAEGIELGKRLRPLGLEVASAEIERGTGVLAALKLHPSLTIRHAGGQLFQEAHFELLRASPSFDLFGLVGQADTMPADRGGAHFTPPTLARSIVEQSLDALGDLSSRRELTICDPACGSGAFLHETVRALRRAGYNGALRLIGYDISAVAISMARFILATAMRDWTPKGGVSIDLRTGDSLGALGMPKADMFLMNPPFISFGSQTPTQQEQLKAATRSNTARGDYSMAFVVRAVESLKDGGVVGTLFPASLLSLKAAESWREQLRAASQVRFLGSIGEFGLFSHALVQVACAVLKKSTPTDSHLTALVTENDPAATSAALRQLRKLRGSAPSAPLTDRSWSIFPVPASVLNGRPTWRLPSPSAERLMRSLNEALLSNIGSLFEVGQGIQTGLNAVLLLSDDEWRALPAREKKEFRSATMSDSIKAGRVVKPYKLFFPHNADGPRFANEDELRKAVPTYFKKYLEPARSRLEARASLVRSRRSDWWGLMHPRAWAFDSQPRLISKFFAAEGGFFADNDAEYVPVMGHIWLPKPSLTAPADGMPLHDILAAYAAFFNSTTFVKILSLYSPHVAGGQFDLSKRHVASIPVPDFRELSTDLERGRAVLALAEQGRRMDLSSRAWRANTANLVSILYGAALAEGLEFVSG